jgi:hypothetical protein
VPPADNEDIFRTGETPDHERRGNPPQAQSYDVVPALCRRALKGELIHSYTGAKGEKRYSLRIGKGFRAIAFRDGVWLRVLALYPDHDSAYAKR